MPLFEYECASGHRREELLKAGDAPVVICSCGLPMARLFPLVHRPPDGIYSFAENIGRPYEKRQQAIEETGRP